MSAPPTKITPLAEAVKDAASTVAQGAPPTNQQLNNVFDQAGNVLQAKKDEAPLNQTGKKIADQMQGVLDSAQVLLNEKNKGEELQRMVMDGKAVVKDAQYSNTAKKAQEVGKDVADQAASATKNATGKTVASVSELKDQTKEVANATVSAAMQFSRELVTSGEFRQLLVDLINLVQEGLFEASNQIQKGAEEASNKLQQAAGKLDEAKSKAATESTEQMKNDAMSAASDAKRSVDQQTQEFKQEAKRQADQVMSDVKDKAADVKDKVMQTASDVYQGKMSPIDALPMSEEKKQQFRSKLDAVLNRIANNESYRRAVDAVFTLFDEYRRVASNALPRVEEVAQTAQQETAENMHLRQMWADAKEFIERWTGETSVDPFLSHLSMVYREIRNDPELTAFWNDVRSYINYAMENPKEAMNQARTDKLNSIIDRARSYRSKLEYNANIRGLVDEGQVLLDSVRNDPQVNDLVNNIRALAGTLFLDTKGNPTLKPEELRQFKILVTSFLMEQLKFIPVPRMEGSTDKYDFSVDNIHFYGFDLIPEHIVLKMENKLDINTKDITTDTALSRFSLSVSNVNCTMKNVLFWFRKKGLIKMEDSGVADVSVGGKGANFVIELELNQNNDKGLTLKTVKCNLDKFHIKVIDSKYDWLLNLAEPFFANDVKRSIEREVEKRIKAIVRRIFTNLRAVLPVNKLDQVKEVGKVVQRELKDIQATKNNLDVNPTIGSA